MQYNNNILNGALLGIQDYATDDSRKRSLAKRTGEKNVNAKLTNSQVRKILRDCSKYLVVDLAREYGVSSTVISYILSNKSWKHVKRKKVERKSHIKITPEIKEKIIAEYSKKKGYEITYVSLAKKYGVSHQSIRDVVLGRYVPKEPAVAQEVS